MSPLTVAYDGGLGTVIAKTVFTLTTACMFDILNSNFNLHFLVVECVCHATSYQPAVCEGGVSSEWIQICIKFDMYVGI